MLLVMPAFSADAGLKNLETLMRFRPSASPDCLFRVCILWCKERRTHFAFSHVYLVIAWDFFHLKTMSREAASVFCTM